MADHETPAEIGAEVASVRWAAAALDDLADELDGWVDATDGLRLELGPGGGDDAGRPPVPVTVRADPVPAAEAVPGLEARRRRIVAELVDGEDSRPHRFAAQESERALHALADVLAPGLERRASDLHAIARSARATAEGFDAAGGGTAV